MKKKINFILGLHNHQPVGNFPHVFKEVFKKAYKPFLQEILNHPDIKVTLHYTGTLYEWFLKEEPGFMETIKKLINRGQVEIMGGGFYEPVLPIIPDEDKKGQIKKMTDFVRYNLGTEVRGIWLAERIWEPHLAKPLAEAGIEYVVVDDYHFKRTGFSEEECTGYYTTEEGGRSLNIFPISEKLRYLVPFKDPCKTIEYLEKMASGGEDRVLVLADDGEKFGSWPDTYGAVYEEGWLLKFFELIKENSSWLEMMTFSEYLDSYPSRGTVYLPNASYREMMEWSGGFWRNFLVRYPESNQIHKKMLAVHQKVYQIKDPRLRSQALDYLWAGQCNCGYWHGVFGGLYLNFLRYALYRSLIKAQVLAEEQLYPQEGWLEVQEEDILFDGRREIGINTRELGIYISPHKGGSIFAFDYKPRCFNLVDTLTRRPETYHKNIFELIENNTGQHNNESYEETCSGEGRGGSGVKTIHEITKVKEKGLEKHLVYDKYQRLCLLDHFLDNQETLEKFKRGNYKEKGNYIMEPYHASIHKDNQEAVIVLSREGVVEGGGIKGKVSLVKEIRVGARDSSVKIVYTIKNNGKDGLNTRFGIEFNYGFLSGYASDRYYYADQEILDNYLASSGEISGINMIGIKDEWQALDLRISFERPAKLWRFPVETVSQSEDGFERNYQGSVIFPFWDLELSPAEEWKLEIKKEIIPG
ncbi:MAG: DUF1926 domain-containing protein [Candidatus Syntrophonatronum acetioxidans]|uniref:DUF1926 domain-containing protein n=1 Tax=Candidatus Syntrophonatronum acetioxidans TaxID=1795816 RepID=A0A424Y910_9FIRM|nr:MAG: DUF1926 domain-containing protein [Candidatus Syntrophonatronum acetioxidans]